MAWLKNNYQFEFTDTLTTSWTSVRISNEKENGAVATFTNQYITVRSEDNSIVERMKWSASAGVLTLTLRWLNQSDVDVEDPALKKERREWAKAFVTYVASQHVDSKDVNTFAEDQTFQKSIIVWQDVTVWDDLNVAWDITTLNLSVSWKSKPVPKVANISARNVLYPSPVDGNMVDVETEWVQYYKTSAGGWVTFWEETPTPDATEAVKGKAKLATNAEALAWVDDTTIMTPLKVKSVLNTIDQSNFYTLWETITQGRVLSVLEDGKAYNYVWPFTAEQTLTVANATPQQIIKLTDTLVVAFYQISSWWFFGYARAGSISWDTITRWTQSSAFYGVDSNSTMRMCRLEDNKFVVATAELNGWLYTLKGTVCTVSGTTITLGTPVVLPSGVKTALTLYDVVKVATDKFVVAFSQTTTLDTLIAATVSGTTITKGTELDTWAIVPTRLWFVSTDVFIMLTTTTAYRCTTSGTTITIGNNVALPATYTWQMVFDFSSTQLIMGWVNWGNVFTLVINWTPTTPTVGTALNTIATSTLLGIDKHNTTWFVLLAGTTNQYVFWNVWATSTTYKNQYSSWSFTTWSIIYLNMRRAMVWRGAGNVINSFVNNEYSSLVWILQSSWVLNDVKKVATLWQKSIIHSLLFTWIRYFIDVTWALTTLSASWVWFGKFIMLSDSATSWIVWIPYDTL